MRVKVSSAVLVVLAVMLCTMCLLAGPALAVKTVSTNDGMSLTLTDAGAFSSLTVDGNTAPTLGVAGGFFIAPMNGIALGYTRDTFYAGTAITGTAVMEGSNVRLTGTAQSISFNILLTGGLPYIKVDGTATGPGTDQAFLVYFRLPVDANGWTWQNDVNSKTTITNGSSNWYHSLGVINQARHPYFSDNPFGTITKTTSPTMGLSISPLFYPPCTPTIQYNSQGGFWIVFELGTTNKTTKHPNTADFHFIVYKHDPNWGQRDAINRFYGFFPAWFTPQAGTRGGNWGYDNNNRPVPPETPAEYGIVWNETSMWDDQYCIDNDIINCKYVEAWCEHCTWTSIAACEAAASSGDNSWYEPGKGWGTAEAAQMIILSGARNANGTYIGFDEQSYWTDDGSMFRAITNPDLEIPNFRGYSNPLPTHNRGTGAEYWEFYREWAVEPGPGDFYSGFYHDSVGGWWAGWEVVHNFATEHWPYYDYSPGIYFGTVGTGPGVPCMFAPYSNVEFLKYTYEEMTARNRPVMANTGPGPTLFMAAPWLDMIGASENYDSSVHGKAIVRAIAGIKPSSYISGAYSSEAAIKDMLLFGIYPGFGGSNDYKNYRSLFLKYTPILNQLDAAGWRPITAARPSNTAMLLERYGTGASNTIYLVLRAPSAGSTSITVYNSDLGWPSSPSCTVTELLLGGSPSTSFDGNGNLVITCGSISASDDRVYKIVRSGGGSPPVANFTGNPTSGTAPLSVAFTDTSTNTPTSWSWVFGDSSTSTAQNPSHSYAAGTYTVSLTATNAYGSDGETKNNYITAGNPPVASFSGTPTSGAEPLAVAFTDSSTNSPTSWSWTFGDGGTSTAQNPSHTYAAGTFTVSLTATNGYGSDGETKSNYITATGGGGSMPTFVAAGAVASGTGAITPALPAGIATNDILLLSLETANQAISISNQNGGTWAEVTGSPQGTGTAGGTAATRLTVFWSRYNGTQGAPTTSDSGNHQAGRIIAIRGAATSGNPWDVTAGGVESTADTSGSVPGATTTVANTLVVAAIATSLPDSSITTNFSAWTNANLSSVTEQTDNTRTAGNGGGLATATGGKATAGAYGSTAVTCATAAAKGLLSIALKPAAGGSAPVANFTGTPTSGTAPLAVSFTDSSTNTPTSWSWAFGDSSTSTVQNPSHSYAAGTYTVTLTATNAYGSDGETKTNYITVSPAGQAPVANFTGTPTTGTAPLAVSFTDTSTNTPTAWSWTFGDSGTSAAQNPSHTFNCGGSYTVSLTATNAYGSDGETKSSYITASPGTGVVYLSDLTWVGTPTNGWGPVEKDMSNGEDQAGDGTTIKLNGACYTKGLGCHAVSTITYNINGQYDRFKADIGLDDEMDVAGSVVFRVEADSATLYTSGTMGPSTTTVSVDVSVAGKNQLVLYVTDGGDGINSDHADWAAARLTPAAGSPPVANFTGTPTTGTAPLSVSFTDTSTNTPTSWSWAFGDSTTSTVQNPSHSYAAGTFTVSLTATNAYGSDGETKTNYITATVAPPVANFTGTPTTGAAPLNVSFTDTSTGSPTSWSWTFGDSSTSTVQHPSHSYAAGTYTVTLTATNAGGSDGETKTNYITATGGTVVTVFPDIFSQWGYTTISGTLADTNTSNNVYLVQRSSGSAGNNFSWFTSYTPSQVYKLRLEYEFKCTLSTQPKFQVNIMDGAGSSWITLQPMTFWTTTDSWFTWETLSPASYMQSDGTIKTQLCTCNQTSAQYDVSLDTVRVLLTLN